MAQYQKMNDIQAAKAHERRFDYEAEQAARHEAEEKQILADNPHIVWDYEQRKSVVNQKGGRSMSTIIA
jgi:hypothetical protein